MTPPSYEVGGIAKRIKTARLRRKTKPGRDVILHVRHNCSIILNINNLSRTRNIASLPCEIVLGDLTQLLKSFFHQGFFAVKRRAVFILGAKWIALVRGWRRDGALCVIGNEFPCRKAHSRTAKCEAFHVAPRLFFMFLFLVPFTIRQQCRIYPQGFFHRTVVCDRFYQYLLFILSLADAFLGCGKFVLLQLKKGDIL